jgi:hypothetical protein
VTRGVLTMSTDRLILVFPLVTITVGVAGHWAFGYDAVVGFIVGAAVGYLPLIALLVGVPLLLGFGYLRDEPPCHCGWVGGPLQHFEFLEELTRSRNSRDPSDPDYQWCYRCPRCNQTWVSKRGVFYELKPDGSLREYKRSTAWGRWIDPTVADKET